VPQSIRGAAGRSNQVRLRDVAEPLDSAAPSYQNRRPLDSDRPSTSTTRFLGVSLASLATLVLELTLTRLFSATMFYHFAFLAISLALFGSGASGVFLYVLRPRLDAEAAPRLLAVFSALFAATTVMGLLVILSHPLSPVRPGLWTLRPLAWIYGAAALPFFFSGCVITLAITAWARQITRLYLFDLAGAAAGCLLLVPALGLFGAIDTVLLVAVLGLLGGFLLSRRRWLLPLLGLAVALVAFNQVTGTIALRESKGLREEGVVFSRWNSFSRVTVAETQDPDRKLIFIDSDAATVMWRDGSDLGHHRELRDRIESLAYHLGGRRKVLIIGPGGGMDVIIARLHGAAEVTAVEVNPLVARDVMSSEPFLSYSGRLYEQPGVRLVVDEGRSFLRRSREHYDLIVGSMVDTWAATAAGAFALSENNLYTVEAFSDYLERLEPDGMLSLTRWYQHPPDQLLRLVSLGREVLAERGAEDPGRHFMIVRGPEEGMPLTTANVLLKKSPFTGEEVERAEAFARRLRLELVYTPRTRPPNDFTRLITTPDPAAFCRSFPSDVSPPRDNSPFFFQTARLDEMFSKRWSRGEWRRTNLGTAVLFGLVAITSLVVAVFILAPLLLVRGRLRATPRRGRLPFLLYFAALGVGFIVVEVVLVQKSVLFLGHPAYALSVVLFAILLFSGLGSRLSGRIPTNALPRALGRVILVVVALIGAAVLLLSPLFYGLVHLANPWRVLITVGALAPLGLALGMPMPTGIRILDRQAPELIPWAWGVNGAASVLGSAGAVALAMVWGFDQALLLGAFLYLVGLGCMTWALRREATGGGSPLDAGID
jgi:spermidine synthase